MMDDGDVDMLADRERHARGRNGTPTDPHSNRAGKRKQPESTAASTVPAKRRRKTAADKEKEREKEREKENAKNRVSLLSRVPAVIPYRSIPFLLSMAGDDRSLIESSHF